MKSVSSLQGCMAFSFATLRTSMPRALMICCVVGYFELPHVAALASPTTNLLRNRVRTLRGALQGPGHRPQAQVPGGPHKYHYKMLATIVARAMSPRHMP